MIIRPATRQDIENFPQTKTKTTRAFVVEEGKPLAVVGYYLDNGRAIIFSEVKEGARESVAWLPRTAYRIGKFILEETKKTGLPIYAGADQDICGSERFLEHLGFVRGYKETFIWKPYQPS